MLTNIAYIIACILFILGIKRLTKPQTARSGNILSAIGMLIAVVTVLFERDVLDAWDAVDVVGGAYLWILIAVVIGSVIGLVWSKKVQMTGMPELVALYNGFGGLASFLVAFTQFIQNPNRPDVMIAVSISLALFTGGITFTGSVLAWGKLSEKLPGKAVVFPGQNIFNIIVLLLIVAASVLYIIPGTPINMAAVMVIAAVSLIFGVLFVLPIGGGDMPVVISLLNALSGVAVAMAGFIISNTVLVVAGALVGASGIILTLIMCKAMNRSITNLLFSGFGAGSAAVTSGSNAEPKAILIEDAYAILEAAESVVFIPGYGMAVAQAQHVVKEFAQKLEANGCEVNFAVHAVAGRMPGHMNVLLAEADIPYEQLKTESDINPIMPQQDVAIVIGANDVVNPAALTDTSSPIYGMPIIKAHEAKTVFILKRGKGRGFSGIENELFTMPNALMIYGDAKATIAGLSAEFTSAI